MSGPPSPASQPMTANGGSNEGEPPPTDQDDAYGYQEDVATQSVPITTGEEDLSLFGSERPGSAGTAVTGEYDVDNHSDDEAVIAQFGNADAETTMDAHTTKSEVERNFLPKPVIFDGADASEGFAYAKARRPSMNITPTRQDPTAYTLPTPRLTGDRVERGGSPNALDVEDPTGVAMQDSSQATGAVFMGNQPYAEQAPASIQQQSGEKKSKKKRPKTRSQPQAIAHEPINAAPHGRGIRDPGADPRLNGHPWDPEAHQHHEVVDPEQTQDPANENNVIQDELQDREGSPDVQLQHDLDTAIQAQHHQIGLPSSHAAPVPHEVDEGDMLPPDHFENNDAHGQPPHPQATKPTPVDQTAARHTGPTAPPRVQKRKPKSSRRTASASQTQAANTNNWRITDYAKLFQIKAEECAAAFASERQALQQNIQQALEARAAVESELDSVLDQKQELTATIDEQRSKVATYAEKMKTFKKFVDGVGKDLDLIRKDANALRRRSDDIVSDLESRGTQNLAAYEEMEERVNDCMKNRKEAVKLARDAEQECHRMMLHRDQLQRELNDTVGVLSEERDRCAKLERQLEDSEKKLFEMVKSSHDATLDKLHLIHAAVEDEQSKKDTSEMIEQLRSATQTGGSPHEAAMQDIAGIKALIEALDQRLNNNVEAAEAAEISTRTYFDEALTGMQAQLADREKLIADHQETVNGLQERLNACNGRIANVEAQKSAADKEVNNLRERNAALQANISALETTIIPAEDSQIRLNETKVELEKTMKELSSSKADIEASVKEVEALTVANTKLGEEVKALQYSIHELQQEDNSASIPRDEVERKVQEAVQRTRKEMADEFDIFETQLKKKYNTELKKLISEKPQLEKQVKALQEQIASCRQQISQMQTPKPMVLESSKQDLERYKKQILSQGNEIEALQSSLNDFKTAATKNEDIQEKYASLSAQFNAEQSKLKQMTEHNSELQQQVKRVNENKEEMELAKDQAHEEFGNLQKETESKIEALEEELAEAKEKATQDNAGLESLKKSCKDAVDKANHERERQIEALQAQLSESRAQLQTKQNENESLWDEMRQAWEGEQDCWKEKLAASTKKVTEVGADKLQAQIDHIRDLEELKITMDKQRASMKEENEELRLRLQNAEESLQTQHRPSSRESKTSTRLHVQFTRDGIPPNNTPNVDTRSTQPSKPRKKIDRTRNETREVDPIQAPEEIRPDSRKTNSANAQPIVKGPVVEKSQLISSPVRAYRTGTPAFRRSESSFSVAPSEEKPDDQQWTSQLESQTISETQLVGDLPKFANFHSKVYSTQAPLSHAALTSGPAHAAGEVTRRVDCGQSHANVIKAFEGTQQQSELCQSQHSHTGANRQQSQTWGQEKDDPYTYRHPRPPPNSGQKRAPSIEPLSNHAQRRGSEHRPGSGRYETPLFEVENVDGNRMSSSHNSTPPFVQAPKPKRRLSTYHTPKRAAGTSHKSQLNTGLISDPRLAGRDQRGRKRKVESSVTEGYESERKKRLGESSNGLEKTIRRAQPQQAQSIHDLPAFGGEPTSSRTRVHTFAPGSSRGTRVTRNASQNDKMNTRFKQALNRR